MTMTARRAAVVAWMAIIFVLSSQPNLRMTDDAGLDFAVRKAGHLFAFGALAVLLLEAISPGRPATVAGRFVWTALALTVAYAVSDELHQAFVAGRGPAATDVLIDGVGAAAALLLWSRWIRPRFGARTGIGAHRPARSASGAQDHPGPDRGLGGCVDQDEAASRAIPGVLVEEERIRDPD